MQTNPVTLTIEYAGMSLQVAKNDQNEDVTPLKPFTDMLGLRWERQRSKVASSPFYCRYLGVCTLHMWGADGQKREQTCILVSRVAAFLMSISPDAVRAAGNVDSAEFLETKLNEWADALHALETYGIAFKKNHRELRADLQGLFKTRTLAQSKSEKDALTKLISQTFSDLGQPLQDEQQMPLPNV